MSQRFGGWNRVADHLLSLTDSREIQLNDGQAASLYVRRLEKGRFLWPSPADGVVAITPAQMGYLLSGIDWRNPVETWRPTSVG